MSVTYIAADLRRLVVARAEAICEYCLVAEEDTFYGCEADHIISEKHGGSTDADHLAYACVFCNQSKGSDVGSIQWDTNTFVRFFNPRADAWADHFPCSNRCGVCVYNAGTTPLQGRDADTVSPDTKAVWVRGEGA